MGWHYRRPWSLACCQAAAQAEVELEWFAVGRHAEPIALILDIPRSHPGQPRRLARRYGIVVLELARRVTGRIQPIGREVAAGCAPANVGAGDRLAIRISHAADDLAGARHGHVQLGVGARGGVEQHAQAHAARSNDECFVAAAVQAAEFEAAVRVGDEGKTRVEEQAAAGDRLVRLGFQQSAAERAPLLQPDHHRLGRLAADDLDRLMPCGPLASLRAAPRQRNQVPGSRSSL